MRAAEADHWSTIDFTIAPCRLRRRRPRGSPSRQWRASARRRTCRRSRSGAPCRPPAVGPLKAVPVRTSSASSAPAGPATMASFPSATASGDLAAGEREAPRVLAEVGPPSSRSPPSAAPAACAEAMSRRAWIAGRHLPRILERGEELGLDGARGARRPAWRRPCRRGREDRPSPIALPDRASRRSPSGAPSPAAGSPACAMASTTAWRSVDWPGSPSPRTTHAAAGFELREQRGRLALRDRRA